MTPKSREFLSFTIKSNHIKIIKRKSEKTKILQITEIPSPTSPTLECAVTMPQCLRRCFKSTSAFSIFLILLIILNILWHHIIETTEKLEKSEYLLAQLRKVKNLTDAAASKSDDLDSESCSIFKQQYENLKSEMDDLINEKEDQSSELTKRLDDMKLEKEQLLKISQHSSSSSSSVEADLPLCDTLFKIDILNNPNYTTSRTPPHQLKTTASEDELRQLVEETGVKDGCWSPKNYCKVRQTVAILVPYRDRQIMVAPFLHFMHTFLQKQHREYCIIFAEQADRGQFNRAKLLNSGFQWMMQNHKFWNADVGSALGVTSRKPDCLVLHDIDLLPEDIKNLYGCLGFAANHLCDKYNKYNYVTQTVPPNVITSGGVLTISTWQFQKTNGCSNRFWGWGYEDHEHSVRLRSYNSSNDENVPFDRRQENDFMKEIVVGTTYKNCDIGMVRADAHGYYTQMRHGRGFTNSKANRKFFDDSAMGILEKSAEIQFWMAFDGLNSNFYKTLKVDYQKALTKVYFEIRPFVPERHVLEINSKAHYDHVLNSQLEPEEDWVDFFHVDMNEYKNDLKVVNGTAEEIFKAQKQTTIHNLEEGWKMGRQHSAIQKYIGLATEPWPLFSVGPGGNTQVVTIKNFKDSLGLFQVLPDYMVANSKPENIENKQIKLKFIGDLLQIPFKFIGLFRIYYEGTLLKSSYQVFKNGTAANSKYTSASNENTFINDTLISMDINRKSRQATFSITHNLNVMPPGIYLFVFRVTDTSNQAYLETFNIMRVRITNQENEEFKLIQEYRSYLCDDDGYKASKEKFTDYCHPPGITTSDDNKRAFLGLDSTSLTSRIDKLDMVRLENTREWNGYYLQKIEESFKSSVPRFMQRD